MDITALHLQFEKLGWEGVAAFAEVVRQLRCGSMSMAFMRQTYAGSTGNRDSGNKLYTVEYYLSDLLSRKDLLTKGQVDGVNQTFKHLARKLQTAGVITVTVSRS